MRDTCYGGDTGMFEKFKKKAAVVKTVTKLTEKDISEEVPERRGSTLIRDLDNKEYDEKTILASKVSNLLKGKRSLSRQVSSGSDSSSSTKTGSRSSKCSSRKSSKFVCLETITSLISICHHRSSVRSQKSVSRPGSKKISLRSTSRSISII